MSTAVAPVTEAEAKAGYQIRDVIAELVEGRPFILIAGSVAVGNVYSNIKSQKDAIAIVSAVLEQLLAVEITPDEPVLVVTTTDRRSSS